MTDVDTVATNAPRVRATATGGTVAVTLATGTARPQGLAVKGLSQHDREMLLG